jgi:hypothetical protein
MEQTNKQTKKQERDGGKQEYSHSLKDRATLAYFLVRFLFLVLRKPRRLSMFAFVVFR